MYIIIIIGPQRWTTVVQVTGGKDVHDVFDIVWIISYSDWDGNLSTIVLRVTIDHWCREPPPLPSYITLNILTDLAKKRRMLTAAVTAFCSAVGRDRHDE